MKRKQINFYRRWQQTAKAQRTAGQKKTLLTLMPAVALVAVSMTVWGVITVRTALLRSRYDDITDWCTENGTAYTAALTDAGLADIYNGLTAYTQDLDDVLAGYPDVTNALLTRIENAGNSSITIHFNAYNASDGTLLFDAKSSEVIDIPTYIRSLQNCGVFSTVTYTGYSYQNGLYTINLRCVLAAPD